MLIGVSGFIPANIPDIRSTEDPVLRNDARVLSNILARQDLIEIQKLIKNSQHMFSLDEMSKAHLSESSSRIQSALEAYLQKKL